jgi:hypothetical protein
LAAQLPTRNCGGARGARRFRHVEELTPFEVADQALEEEMDERLPGDAAAFPGRPAVLTRPLLIIALRWVRSAA